MLNMELVELPLLIQRKRVRFLYDKGDFDAINKEQENIVGE